MTREALVRLNTVDPKPGTMRAIVIGILAVGIPAALVTSAACQNSGGADASSCTPITVGIGLAGAALGGLLGYLVHTGG